MMMVEVFKTNVQYKDHADRLVSEIHTAFPEYTATFDLEDCDKILRVQSAEGAVLAKHLIELVKKCGFLAEVLPDEPVTEVSTPFGYKK